MPVSPRRSGKKKVRFGLEPSVRLGAGWMYHAPYVGSVSLDAGANGAARTPGVGMRAMSHDEGARPASANPKITCDMQALTS